MKHALLITQNHIWSLYLNQSFETVITDNNAAVEIIEVRSSETTTIQWYQRTQLRRSNRHSLKNHPLRTVLTLAGTESLYYLQTLECLLTTLNRSRFICSSTQLIRQLIQIDGGQKVIDSLSTHLHYNFIRICILQQIILFWDQISYLQVLVFIQKHTILNRNTILITCVLLTYLSSCQNTSLYNQVFLIIDDRIQFLSRNTEQCSHFGRQRAQIPYVCYWNNKLNVSHTLTTHFLLSNLYTTTLAHDTFITDTLVFTTMALVILGRTEDALAE